MTNFFLEELRKIYGDGRVIHDPQFVGECCYGSLGDLRVFPFLDGALWHLLLWLHLWEEQQEMSSLRA